MEGTTCAYIYKHSKEKGRRCDKPAMVGSVYCNTCYDKLKRKEQRKTTPVDPVTPVHKPFSQPTTPISPVSPLAQTIVSSSKASPVKKIIVIDNKPRRNSTATPSITPTVTPTKPLATPPRTEAISPVHNELSLLPLATATSPNKHEGTANDEDRQGWGYIYVVTNRPNEAERLYKVGKTTGGVSELYTRYKTYIPGLYFKLIRYTRDVGVVEKLIHKHLEAYVIYNDHNNPTEWFKVNYKVIKIAIDAVIDDRDETMNIPPPKPPTPPRMERTPQQNTGYTVSPLPLPPPVKVNMSISSSNPQPPKSKGILSTLFSKLTLS